MSQSPEFLTQAQIAVYFGVHKDALSKAIPFLEGFPACQQRGRLRRYPAAAVKAWKKGKNIPALVRAATAKSRAGKSASAADAFNAACRLFITGVYAAPQACNQIEMKKLAARHCSKRSKRLVVTIIPDWTQDQRGYNEPQTKIIERTV